MCLHDHSCIQRKMKELDEQQRKLEHEGLLLRRRADHDLEMEQKRDELEFSKEQAEVEVEKQKRDYLLNKEKQIAQIEVLEMKGKQEHQQALQRMEARQQEQELKLKQDMSELKLKQERQLISHQDQMGRLEVQERKQEKELELEQKREEEKQKRDHIADSHALDLKLKESQQIFEQNLKQEQAENQMKMDAEFNARTTLHVNLKTQSGNTAQIKFAQGLDPEIYKMFATALTGSSPVAVEDSIPPQETSSGEKSEAAQNSKSQDQNDGSRKGSDQPIKHTKDTEHEEGDSKSD